MTQCAQTSCDLGISFVALFWMIFYSSTKASLWINCLFANSRNIFKFKGHWPITRIKILLSMNHQLSLDTNGNPVSNL